MLYMLFELISGFILTMLYMPHFTPMNSGLNAEVVFASQSGLYFLGTLFIATLAYFISQRMFRTPIK